MIQTQAGDVIFCNKNDVTLHSWCTITSHETTYHTRYHILWSCFLQENQLLVSWRHLHGRKSSKMGPAFFIATLLIYYIHEQSMNHISLNKKKRRLRCYTESEDTPARYSDMHCSKLFRIFIAMFRWCCDDPHQVRKVQMTPGSSIYGVQRSKVGKTVSTLINR